MPVIGQELLEAWHSGRKWVEKIKAALAEYGLYVMRTLGLALGGWMQIEISFSRSGKLRRIGETRQPLSAIIRKENEIRFGQEWPEKWKVCRPRVLLNLFVGPGKWLRIFMKFEIRSCLCPLGQS